MTPRRGCARVAGPLTSSRARSRSRRGGAEDSCRCFFDDCCLPARPLQPWCAGAEMHGEAPCCMIARGCRILVHRSPCRAPAAKPDAVRPWRRPRCGQSPGAGRLSMATSVLVGTTIQAVGHRSASDVQAWWRPGRALCWVGPDPLRLVTGVWARGFWVRWHGLCFGNQCENRAHGVSGTSSCLFRGRYL